MHLILKDEMIRRAGQSIRQEEEEEFMEENIEFNEDDCEDMIELIEGSYTDNSYSLLLKEKQRQYQEGLDGCGLSKQAFKRSN